VKRGICKLCLFAKDLQDSHLMPAGIYKRTRTPGAKSPHRLAVTNKGIRRTSEQIRDYVLCADCESRFDRGGENYVMRLVSTKTRFPLLEKLEKAPLFSLGKDWKAYAEADTPDVDRDVIAYFALSVFWRASVHRWNWGDGRTVSIDLGKMYNETIRQYLLGAPFPQHVHLFVVACTDKTTQDVFFMPTFNTRLGAGRQYSFGARGLGVMLHIGKGLPDSSRMMSCMTPPERYIWTRDGKEVTMASFGRLLSQHSN
jgi:hypothetical protein